MSSQNSAIGSGIGALAGSIIPGIGTMLGGTLGGAIGGLFGPTSSTDPQQQQAQQWRQQAIDAANQQYAGLAPYRAMGLNTLSTAQAPNLSSIYSGGPQYTSISSPLLGQAQGAEGSLLGSLTNGPNYLGQAQTAIQNYDIANQPALAAQMRTVGQDASRLGRIGSEGVTTSLGNLANQYQTNKMLTENQLLTNALNQTQQDKYANLGAAQGIANQQYSQGAAERANQQQVAQQGVSNRAAQFGAQQGAQAQQFGQGMGLAGLGNSYNPSGVLLNAAGGAQGAGQFNVGQQNLNANDVASLFGVAGQLLGRRGGSSGFTGTQD